MIECYYTGIIDAEEEAGVEGGSAARRIPVHFVYGVRGNSAAALANLI